MTTYLAKPQRFLIRPASGWADQTLDDVQNLLNSPTQKYKFEPTAQIEEGVIILQNCDYRLALELMARLTTAHDVEWVIHSGRVSSRGDWAAFFEKSGIGNLLTKEVMATCRVSAMVTHPVVGTAKEIRKIAVDSWGVRSIVNGDGDEQTEGSMHRIRIDSAKNRTRILVSMGGEPLYKRNYKAKDSTATAPLPEHHASACFLWASKFMSPSLLDSINSGATLVAVPFAGTGTPGFEALCRAKNFAPSLSRSNYACEDFTFHPVATMASIRKKLASAQKFGVPKIVFGDINHEALTGLAKQVSSFANVTKIKFNYEIMENDFLSDPETLVSGQKSVFLPLNPPYGLRLAKQTGGVSIYERLGQSLIKLAQITSVSGYVICPDEESWSAILKKLNKFKCHTRHFTHGGHDTRLVAFSMDTQSSM